MVTQQEEQDQAPVDRLWEAGKNMASQYTAPTMNGIVDAYALKQKQWNRKYRLSSFQFPSLWRIRAAARLRPSRCKARRE